MIGGECFKAEDVIEPSKVPNARVAAATHRARRRWGSEGACFVYGDTTIVKQKDNSR